MQYLKEHTFPNGNVLVLDVANSFAGLHGLKVYTVFYGDKDGDCFNAIGSEPFMGQDEAEQAFDKRVTSTDPSEPSREHGGFYEIVLEIFKRYLGEHTLRREPLPTDWAGFYKYVMDQTFLRISAVYNDKVYETLNGLNTVSSKHSDGRSEAMLEIPAWKVLEMLTAITDLATIVRQLSETRARIAA